MSNYHCRIVGYSRTFPLEVSGQRSWKEMIFVTYYRGIITFVLSLWIRVLKMNINMSFRIRYVIRSFHLSLYLHFFFCH